MAALQHLTLCAAQAGLARGDFSALELTEAILAAIGRVDERVGAYVEVQADEARTQARAADERRAGGDPAPLLGLPLAIKDLLNVKGQSCACASRLLEGYLAPYDATAIARLRAAGAVFLGRTNMDEFAMGSTTENSARGPTRNPWDLNRVPGGSSGGAAAAVAAREALAGLGSDTGGSIRQPAAFCGCVGLKPTYGRVSRYGLTAFASSLDQIGPLTRTVEDAALLLGVIAGHDPMDSTSVNRPVPDYRAAMTAAPRGLTVGLPTEYFGAGLDGEVAAAVRAAGAALEAQGVRLVEVSLPRTPLAVAVYYIIATAEASANLARFDGIRYGRRETGPDPLTLYRRTRAAGFGDEVKRRIILGTYVLSSGYYDAYYRRAQQVRTLIRQDFEQAFTQCDALLAPVTPRAAYRLGECLDDPLQMYLGDVYTVTANLAGICGLALPCGFTQAGLPIGCQLLGRPFEESTLLRLGHAYEQATDWQDRCPPVCEGAPA